MQSPVDLATLGSQELRNFINSFDSVLTDCDGVLYHIDQPIPGVASSINKLQDLNKEICFVSNNTCYSLDNFHKRLIKMGYKAEKENIVFPTLSIIDYLKSINFKKEVYVFGVEDMKIEFEGAGIKVADCGSIEIENNFSALKREMIDNPDIGAVIIDMDINTSYVKLMRAALYLRRSDVLFIAGATDKKCPMGNNFSTIAPGLFLESLEDFTGRKAKVFGKPSPNLHEFISKKFDIQNPERILFIGDSLYQDMSFASYCGYQKLFVQTGISTLKEAKTVKSGLRPDYYLKSLGDLNDLLECNL